VQPGEIPGGAGLPLGLTALLFPVPVVRQTVDRVRDPFEKNESTILQYDQYDSGNKESGNGAQEVKPHDASWIPLGEREQVAPKREAFKNRSTLSAP
jgi:hypothetical protein